MSTEEEFRGAPHEVMRREVYPIIAIIRKWSLASDLSSIWSRLSLSSGDLIYRLSG